MLEKNLEFKINLNNRNDFDSHILKSYSAKPTELLKGALNILTENYYNDCGYEELDKVQIDIDKNYNILVSTWILDVNSDWQEINDVVKININNNFKIIELITKMIEEI